MEVAQMNKWNRYCTVCTPVGERETEREKESKAHLNPHIFAKEARQ